MWSIFCFLSAIFWSLALAASPEEIAEAGIDGHAKATYFVNSGYVFALNVVENGDVYYHMSAPSTHSWIGVGFGGNMENTRMLISYLGADGANLTNSCRMAYGHSEPEHDPTCVIEPVVTDHYAPYHNSLSPDGILIAHAVCRACASWAGGALDLENQAQPFIYAFGPNDTLHSDDLNAPLRLHVFYGTFNMDMTKASNTTGDYGRVPAPQDPALQVGHAFWAFGNYYSSTPYSTGTLADWSPTAHAICMCLAFLLVFPLGAISLRLVRRIMFHAAAQMVGVVFVILGTGFGVYAAKLYNKSKHFNSTHQILGLLILVALLLQIGLGLSHHLIFMRSGSSTVMGKVHRFLGVSIMILAVINGGLGFKFAQTSVVPYAIAAPIMAIVLGAIAAGVSSYNGQHTYRPEKEGFIKDHGPDSSEDYEMHNVPFAKMSHVQTPRTPFFTNPKQADGPENYRALFTRTHSYKNAGQDVPYTDNPDPDTKDPVGSRWETLTVS